MAILELEQLRAALLPAMDALPKNKFLGAFAFGECMEPHFQPKKQPFDIGLVLESVNPRELPDLTALLKGFASHNARLGFLFTTEKVHSAADTFPLEFLNISNRSYLLTGMSPLDDFSPNPMSLRLQCERELRGLLIHLHREYVLHHSSGKELKTLLAYTFPRFQPVFRGIYWLFNRFQYPSTAEACMSFIDSQWQLGGMLGRIEHPPTDSSALLSLAGDYISSMEQILKTIDHMEVLP